jgi:hypothetical protein
MRATEFTTEAPLTDFEPMGNFDKPGPFKGPDKKLVPHPTNQLKAQKFFENTPYDFRLFFSNISGTGKYNEYGPMQPDVIKQVFGEYADKIVNGSQDAITVVFVGNTGDAKVPLTPWVMAHRFGHAIQAGSRRNSGWHVWTEAEKHFFNNVNECLTEYYGKTTNSRERSWRDSFKYDLTPEYNALFNAIGTQRSSRSGLIKRPYEFLYEIFAQYLGTGSIKFNPIPSNLGYGRQNWGNPSKYLNIKPEYNDEGERQNIADTLAYDMQLMFDDVLSNCVGQIYVM